MMWTAYLHQTQEKDTPGWLLFQERNFLVSYFPVWFTQIVKTETIKKSHLRKFAIVASHFDTERHHPPRISQLEVGQHLTNIALKSDARMHWFVSSRNLTHLRLSQWRCAREDGSRDFVWFTSDLHPGYSEQNRSIAIMPATPLNSPFQNNTNFCIIFY